MQYSSEEIVKHMNTMQQGSITGTLGIKIVVAEQDKVVGTMPVEPNRQPAGYLHGGASVVLAESLASLGTALNIDGERQMAFGQEINANHLRPKRDGIVTGTATPIYKGRTSHVWEIRITDENNRLICISRCTVAIVHRPPVNGNPLTKGE